MVENAVGRRKSLPYRSIMTSCFCNQLSSPHPSYTFLQTERNLNAQIEGRMGLLMAFWGKVSDRE